MFKYEYQDSIIFWTITTAHAMERSFNEVLQPLGMTFRQAEVLAWLVLEGTLSQVDLAERMRVEAPTLAGIVERMERAGWVVRTQCPRDRRRKLLSPTDRVGPVWEQVQAAGRAVRAKAGAGILPEDLQEVMQRLEQIQKNLGQENTRPGRTRLVRESE
jgi:MarR family transcriptional regulator for hemolysin